MFRHIARSANSSVRLGHGYQSIKPFGMLVPTEEFPMKFTVEPKPTSPAVIKQNILANGIKVITRDYNSAIVTLKFAVMGGSSAETAAEIGAAHFLSTAAFAGNRTNTGLRIVRFFESMGAKILSAADKEKIVYEVKVLPDRVNDAVAALISILSTPPHAKYVLDDVKSRESAIYQKVAGNYQIQLKEMLLEAAYGEETGLGSPSFALNLENLSTENVLAFREKQFVASNIVVSGSGISQEKLEAAIAANENVLQKASVTALGKTAYSGGYVRVRKDLDGKTVVGLGFPVVSGVDSKPYQIVYGALQSKLQSKKISPFFERFSCGGLIGFSVEGNVEEVTTLLQTAINEVKAISKGSINIDNIKKKIALENFLRLEGEECSTELLESHILAADVSALADVRSVDKAAVAAAAAAMLQSPPSYAVLGTTAGSPPYKLVTSWLK